MVGVLVRTVAALLIPGLVALGGRAGAAEPVDPASAAAAALAGAPVYLSPQAQQQGTQLAAPKLPAGVRIAVIGEDEGSAGQVAAAILQHLTAAGVAVQTVAVIGVSGGATQEIHAASTDRATFCKGGADLAARRALATDAGGTDLGPLVAAFTAELARLPPDRGESSCASAAAKSGDDSGTAWLWWLLAALVGVGGIAAFAIYSRRTVAARRAAGEVPEEEGFISVEYEDEREDEREDESD